MYISIYICSPVKQKNTEFFQKKTKNRKIPDKNKNGTVPSKQPKINPVTNILKSKANI